MKVKMLLLVSILIILGFIHVPQKTIGGDDVVVIVNKKNPTRKINISTVKNIYLGQKAFWHGTVPIRVFIVEKKASSGKAILNLLDMTASQYENYWVKRALAGKGIQPATKTSASELAEAVAKSPTAMGVILRSDLDQLSPKVRALKIKR